MCISIGTYIFTMVFFSVAATELPPNLYVRLLRYRYRVFVEKLRWDVPSQNGMEFDQFDRSDTVHVIGRDAEGRIGGCCRLLPTSKPYLLKEVFPELMAPGTLPASPTTWELSRFTTHDLYGSGAAKRNCFLSDASIGLLRYSMATAAALGARHLVFVAAVGTGSLIDKLDIDIEDVGQRKNCKGHRLSAYRIAL